MRPARCRQPGNVSAFGNLGVPRFFTDLVDAYDLDVQQRVVVVQLVLHLVEVAKLATTVISRRFREVPSGNLLHVSSRRDLLIVGRRGRVDVQQGEVRCQLTDAGEHLPGLKLLESESRSTIHGVWQHPCSTSGTRQRPPIASTNNAAPGIVENDMIGTHSRATEAQDSNLPV